jgi:CubicO group peptidase (beta-lactamase class C family)
MKTPGSGRDFFCPPRHHGAHVHAFHDQESAMPRVRTLLALAGLLMGVPAREAVAAEAACTEGLEARAEAILAPYSGRVPGASLLVVQDGKALLRLARGYADLEAGREATPLTNYRLASVSKQFTAMAVLLLVQEGKLALDAPVRQWLPTLPAATKDVTLRHLLSHRSGVVDYEDFVADDAPQVRDADVLAMLEHEDRSLFAPGADYRYSNSGYALLALVVERASGKPYPDFLRERIFAPLGMRATLARVDEGPAVAERAFGYRLEEGAWVRRDQSSTSAVLGDGGIYSSIDDLAKWDAALYDDRLLGGDLRAQMFSRQGPTDDPAVDYGFGWRLTAGTLWHSGESQGFRNVLIRDPARRATVILLSNRDDPEPYAFARSLLACLPERSTTSR